MIRVQNRGFIVAAGVAAGVCGAAAPAWGEVGAPGATVQAIAADAQFLEYAPPPPAPGVVCLIDSGVDPNPDTTPILAGSYATQPGTDSGDELSKLNPKLQPGNHPDGHGTYMAMIMAAPVNGWGMVGIAPTSVRVFNLKVLGAGQNTFSFAEYANSIEHCVDGPVGVSNLSVINLSLGSNEQPSEDDYGILALAVADARSRGIEVVGSAGNNGGGVAFPAAISGVLAVGATDANSTDLGVFCASSDRGPALGLLAPGCGTQNEAGGGGDGIDVAFSDDGTPAWATGTSEASAVVSSVAASMRAYDPSLTPAQAEGCLTSSAANGGNLDAAAAFRACGLGAIVSDGLAAYAAATTASPPSTSSATAAAAPSATAAPAPTAASRSRPLRSRPRVLGILFRRGRLTIAVAGVPHGDELRVNVQRRARAGRYETAVSKTFTGRLGTVGVRNWNRVGVLFVRGDRRSDLVEVNRGSKLVSTSRLQRAAIERRGP